MVTSSQPPIGVLALQGDYREHLAIFASIGVSAVPVKTKGDLEAVGALVIPGGESTAIFKLRDFWLVEPIKSRIASGMPVLGTCAGLILLANQIIGGIEGQHGFGGLAVAVRRNAFGNQLDSFEAEVSAPAIQREPLKVAFIRAPIIESIELEVRNRSHAPHAAGSIEVLSRLDDGRIIAVRQGRLIGGSFHPELTGEVGLHRYFANLVAAAG